MQAGIYRITQSPPQLSQSPQVTGCLEMRSAIGVGPEMTHTMLDDPEEAVVRMHMMTESRPRGNERAAMFAEVVMEGYTGGDGDCQWMLIQR